MASFVGYDLKGGGDSSGFEGHFCASIADGLICDGKNAFVSKETVVLQ